MGKVSDLVAIGMTPVEANHLGYNIESGLTASGTNSQANGYAITADYNQFTTVTAANNSATLPSASLSSLGLKVVRNDDSADILQLYPASGESFNALSANTAIGISPGGLLLCFRISDTKWLTISDLETRVAAAESSVLSLEAYVNKTDSVGGGWWSDGGTWTYASGTTVTASGAASIPIGTKIQISDSGGFKYGYIISRSGTTLTLLLDTALANSALTVKLRMMDAPYGFPDYIAFTPTTGSNAGTWTLNAITFAKLAVSGKRASVSVYYTGTQSVANADYITFTVPILSASLGDQQFAAGYVNEGGTTGGLIAIQNNSATVRVYKGNLAQFDGAALSYCISNFYYLIP